MSGNQGPDGAAKAVELFHSYHVQTFLQSVGQAADRLHQALEQIKSTGHELPKVPQFKFVPQTGNKQSDAAAAFAGGAGPPLPAAAIAANPADSGTNVMAQLQSMLMGTASLAPPVVDPNALGSALTALAAFMTPAAAAAPAAEESSPAALKVRTEAPKGTPSRKSNDPSGKHGNVAAPATPAVGAAAVRPFSTPPSRRKRPAESPAPGAPKSKESGQRRRVRVVQNAQWPEGTPGKASSPASGKAATKIREDEGLAALSAAASQVEDEEVTASTADEGAGGDSGGEEQTSTQVTAAQRQASLGSWTEAEKKELVKMVHQTTPCGASEWETVAEKLGRGPRGGASAERMYRTLTDPAYHKSNNPHGRRLNPRKGSTPMHLMATFALQKLPNNEGNLSQIGDLITSNDFFSKDLDWSPRPGTKTYPRWKDALVGCFKPGRYPHLMKTSKKTDGLTVYKLETSKLSNPLMAAGAGGGASGS